MHLCQGPVDVVDLESESRALLSVYEGLSQTNYNFMFDVRVSESIYYIQEELFWSV